eukprot:463187_1
MSQKCATDSTRSGALPHGNFPDYYTFNPPANRIEFIPTDFLKRAGLSKKEDLSILDIGCNSGDLLSAFSTKVFVEYVGKISRVSALGIDLDGDLIDRAQKTYSTFPDSSPGSTVPISEKCLKSSDDPGAISSKITIDMQFAQLDIMSDSAEADLSSLRHRFKSCNSTGESTVTSQPTNSGHLVAIPTELTCRFDLVLVFGVTMWIHLNHGDGGLNAFSRELVRWPKF